ncbi:MAG: SAM-dependent methyltransferase [Clostridia bacterium]|nr:SAM-dependent methyltransferase [Clostridia bacterium]
MKKLDNRLQLVADMIDQNSVVADIGTDHAYLPVYLVEAGIIPSAIAADLRPGPLEHAKTTVEAARLQEKILLRLSDGLDGFQPYEADCVVMAGMGGILITQLIKRAEWLRDTTKTLVLQPMTDASLLRTFLAENGFAIVNERATSDKKYCYTVIKAVYNGECHTPSLMQSIVGGFVFPLGQEERR